jgi:hypothetical protein
VVTGRRELNDQKKVSLPKKWLKPFVVATWKSCLLSASAGPLEERPNAKTTKRKMDSF